MLTHLSNLVHAWLPRHARSALPRRPGDQVIDVSTRNIRYRMHCESSVERMRLATRYTKEPDLLDWIDRWFVGQTTFYDVGANVGLFSLYAAARNPQGIVIAIEPAPQNAHRLCENILTNSITNVVPCTAPIDSMYRCGRLHLASLERAGSMHSLNNEDNLIAFGQHVVLSILVAATSLDDIATTSRVELPSMIKIDVDGAELDVLRGANKVLTDRTLRTIMVELNWTSDVPSRRARLESLATAYDFKPVREGRRYRRGCAMWQNLYFEREA
jgi:FkbM family methyltransferase